MMFDFENEIKDIFVMFPVPPEEGGGWRASMKELDIYVEGYSIKNTLERLAAALREHRQKKQLF